MVIFKSENELIDCLDQHDDLVRKCASDSLPFWDFVKKYNNFYWHYALDGHESDEEECSLLEKYDNRIKLHIDIAEKVLQGVCSDEDAKKEIYIKANRFGSEVAVEKIRDIATRYLGH